MQLSRHASNTHNLISIEPQGVCDGTYREIAWNAVLLALGSLTPVLAADGPPHPATNPSSPVMLVGDWFDHPHAINNFSPKRMSDGRYALVSNSHPTRRDPLTLAISDDGLVFDRLYYLVGGQRNGVDYPMVMEHDGYLLIAHSGGYGGRKQSVELQRVRIADLEGLEMTDARAAPLRALLSEPGAMQVDGISIAVHLEGDWGTSDRAEEKYAQLPEAGVYEVFAWWNSRGSRYHAVPYVIHHAGGAQTVTVDQNQQGGRWVSLGCYRFRADEATVELKADGFPNYVVAEAVRFVPVADG